MSRYELRSILDSWQVDLMIVNQSQFLFYYCSLYWLRILLPFIFYRLRMLQAIFLPSQIAQVVSCSIFAFRVFAFYVLSLQQPQKMTRSLPQRFYQGSSNILPSFLFNSSLLSLIRLLKWSSCSRISCLRVDGLLTLKRSLKDSISLMTQSKKATTQFCQGRIVMDCAGLQCKGIDFLLLCVATGPCLLSSAIFFFRKLFQRLSCSISMRQHRSSSMHQSESWKLWSK